MDASSYWGPFGESGGGLLPRNWGWFLLRGLLALSLGAMALLFPKVALSFLTFAFAVFALADGAFSVLAGAMGAERKGDRWWELILQGAVGASIGVLFLAAPTLTIVSHAIAFLILLSGWSIATGTFEITSSVRLRREIRGEWLLALSGMVSLLLGIAVPLVLLIQPALAILSVGGMIGVYALASGIILVALAFRLREHRRKRLTMWGSDRGKGA